LPRLVAAILALALALSGFAAYGQELQVDKWQGRFGGPPKAQATPIQTAADWKGVWALFQPGAGPPPFDTAKHMGLVVALGQRPTTGYSLELVSIGPQDGRLVVELKEIEPSGQVAGQAITSPWLILRFNRVNMPLKVVGLDVAGFRR